MKHGGEATVAKPLAFAVTSVAMTKDRRRLITLAEDLGGEALAIQLRARITRLDDLPAAIRFFSALRHAA
jgi:hypothetical protein